MPVFQQKTSSNQTIIGIWHITESLNLLEELFREISNKPIIETKSEARVKQWIATRLLVNSIIKDVEIEYNSLGKPTLSNGWNISISHSEDFVAVSINQTQDSGIDVEKVSSKVERIKHKFLSEEDLQKVKSLDELTLFWSAKEALYKYYGKKEVLFIENLFIENFSLSSNSFTGIIKMPDFETELKMEWEKINDYILVYTE